jgi:hypothetical protein
MPLFEFKCLGCGNIIDEIMKYKDKENFIEKHCCANCHGNFKSIISQTAKMATQWAGWQEGLSSNEYSAALGRKVVNKRQEAEIAKSMGFIPLSDLKQDFVETKVEEQRAEDAHFDKMNDAYQEKLKEGGGTYGAAIKAVEELMPAKTMLKEAEKHGD